MTLVCARITVSGYVQGVGYRYFAHDRAKMHGLKGWVRNISGGRVESAVEGEKSAVENYIADLRTGPINSTIDEVEVVWEEHSGKFDDFRITH